MQLSQIFELVIEWWVDADLNGVNFNVNREGKDRIVITKG